MQATNEKPNSGLLSNMEMGNAAFWTNGDSGAPSPEGAGSAQEGARAADADGAVRAAADSPPAAAAPKQSE